VIVDARVQRRVQRYGWDKAADYYERFWAKQLEPAQRRLLQLAALEPGERVLDVACGTGLVTLPAAEAVGPRGSVLGTDISEEMVRSLENAAKTRGFTHVTARRMDAERLELADAAFDVVLCALGLMYVPDPLQALREVRRVLRPGGRLVFSEPNLANPQVLLMFKCDALKPWFGVSPDEMGFTRRTITRVLRRIDFRRFAVTFFDFLHPAIPAPLLPFLEPVAERFERVPLVRAISGSMLIHAEC